MYNPVFKYLAAKSTKVTTGTTELNSKAEAEAYDTTKGNTQYASNFDWTYVPAEIDEEYSILTLEGVLNYYPINENCSYPFARKIYKSADSDYFVSTGDFAQIYIKSSEFKHSYTVDFWNFNSTIGLKYINPTDNDPARLEKLQNAYFYFTYTENADNTITIASKIEQTQNFYDVYVTDGIISFSNTTSSDTTKFNFVPMTYTVYVNRSKKYYRMTENKIKIYLTSNFSDTPDEYSYSYSNFTNKLTLTKDSETATLDYVPVEFTYSEYDQF